MPRGALCCKDKIRQEQTLHLIDELGVSADILTAYSDPNELFERLEGGKRYDFYLLEPESGGIELARFLRRMEDDPVIVFLSASEEYAMEAYRLRVCRYLMYPFQIEELREAVRCVRDLCFLRRYREERTFRFRTEAGAAEVALRRIVYVELLRRAMWVHLLDGTILPSLSLRTSFEHEAAELLEADGFSQVHKSYIVNLDHVESIGQSSLTTTAGDEIPISKRKKQRLSKEYLYYQSKKIDNDV